MNIDFFKQEKSFMSSVRMEAEAGAWGQSHRDSSLQIEGLGCLGALVAGGLLPASASRRPHPMALRLACDDLSATAGSEQGLRTSFLPPVSDEKGRLDKPESEGSMSPLTGSVTSRDARQPGASDT